MQEKTSGKIIYLTIDDGPSVNTPKVLEILDRYHVKATFFVTAQCPSYLGYIKTAYQKAMPLDYIPIHMIMELFMLANPLILKIYKT